MTLQFEQLALAPFSSDPEIAILSPSGTAPQRVSISPSAFDLYRAQILSNASVQGYWKLEDNSTVLQQEIGPSLGSASGATTWPAGGPITGLCPSSVYAEFDNSAKFGTIPNNLPWSLTKTQPFTFEWYGRHPGTLTPAFSKVVGIPGVFNVGVRAWYALAAADQMFFTLVNTTSGDNTVLGVDWGSHNASTWYRYAVVYSGPTGAPGEISIYRDGILGNVISTTGAAFVGNFNGGAQIGLGADVLAVTPNGPLPAGALPNDMAQFAFYNTALTAGELLANANPSIGGPFSHEATWRWTNPNPNAADVQLVGAPGALGRAKLDNGAFTEELHTRFFYSVNGGSETEFEPNDLLPAAVNVPAGQDFDVRVEFSYDENLNAILDKVSGYLSNGINFVYEDNAGAPAKRVAFPVNFSAELLP